MSAEARGDLKYSGNMTIPGGVYKRVDFNGNVTVDGDMDCLDIRVNGNYEGSGSLKANTGRIHGNAKIKGDFESGDIDVNGSMTIGGDMAVKEIKTNGKLVVKGDVQSDTIDANGEFRVRGNCNAESFLITGMFTVEQTLNAGKIDAGIFGPSSVKEIGGEKITVRKGGHKLAKAFATLFDTMSLYKTRLEAETIEGDNIELEHTTAKVVRGNNVTIGDGCEIDLVEYTGEFKKSLKASVLKHVKV